MMSDSEDDGGYGSYESDSEFYDGRDGLTQEDILVVVLSTALFAYTIPLEPPRIGNWIGIGIETNPCFEDFLFCMFRLLEKGTFQYSTLKTDL